MANLSSLRPSAVRQIRDEMDKFLDSLSGAAPAEVMRRLVAARGVPAINLWEQDQVLMLEAELPGVSAEDVDLIVRGSQLSLKGRRRRPVENVSYHRREREEGDFSRIVQLPCEVDPSGVEASLNNGLLVVRLPKVESIRPRKIPVNEGTSGVLGPQCSPRPAAAIPDHLDGSRQSAPHELS